MWSWVSVLLLLAACSCHALYSPKSDVVTIFDENKFKTEVLKHPGVAIVEFYGNFDTCNQLPYSSPPPFFFYNNGMTLSLLISLSLSLSFFLSFTLSLFLFLSLLSLL